MTIKNITQEQKAEILRLCNAGATLGYMVEACKLSKYTVIKLIDEVLPGQNRVVPIRDATVEVFVCDKYREGMAKDQISKKVLKSTKEINKILRQYGVLW